MNSALFQKAIARFNEENSKDPHTESDGKDMRPRELLYAERLSQWVLKLSPDASEPLKLASYCQHLCRWEIPRNSYEMNRTGYLKWRSDLKKFHAEKTGAILKEVGYDDDTIRKVQELNLKKNFPKDPECQTLEDALCLVFLQHQFSEFCTKNPDEKVVEVVQKTWKKMSEQGRMEAMKLQLSDKEKNLVQRALTV